MPFRGQTLLEHAIRTARETTCHPVLVVLGSEIEVFRAEVVGLGAQAVANPGWAMGIGSSVRVAIEAIEAGVPAAVAALFTVCDQPLVTSDLLVEIVRAHQGGHNLVATAYDGTVGVPALFARSYFGELRGLAGDAGARRVLIAHRAAVFAVPFAGGAVDIDTPEDVARLADRAGEFLPGSAPPQ